MLLIPQGVMHCSSVELEAVEREFDAGTEYSLLNCEVVYLKIDATCLSPGCGARM